MKKIFILILLFTSLLLISCSTTTLESDITTLLTDTTSTTVTESTSSQSLETQSIENELSYLNALIPREITEDLNLPSASTLNMTIKYYQDELLLSNDVFVYTASLEGIDSVLKIEITYNGVTLSDTVTIRLTENETQYNTDLITSVFLEVNNTLNSEIPSVISTDFKLPVLDIDGLHINYSVDVSSIYNGYFIYPFPDTEQLLTLDIEVVYQGIQQFSDFTIRVQEISLLDRIPEIRINTIQNEEVISRDDYVYGDFSLVTYGINQEPITIYNDQSFRIRCRGNSTYDMPKLSYRLKFSEKTDLLFDYEENDWVLLANFSDQTLIRTYLANSLSASMGMEFTPSSAFVDVYINDEYLGNYMLTDQIEVTNDRVDIEEKSANLDTGYLIEFDKRMLDPDLVEGIEGWDFFNMYGVPYVIKSPKTDKSYYSQEQFYYIEDYFITTFNILKNGLDYSNYIDESTFIDWFIVNELFQNVDAGYSSVYFYKDVGGLLKMGPVWDFDLSTGNPGHLDSSIRKPEGWYTTLPYKNVWFTYLMEYDSFKLHLLERWNELYDTAIQDLLESVYPVAASITRSRYYNFQKWNVIGSWESWYTATEVLEADTYQKQLEFLYYFLSTRSEWLNEEINKF